MDSSQCKYAGWLLLPPAVDALRAAGWEPLLAVDDDVDVVAAYHRAGVPCFRAGFAPG